MNIAGNEADYLIQSIKNGSAMLVLGAGASASSTNARDEKIKSGWGLAKELCRRAGMSYADEPLVDVLGAVRGSILSDRIIHEVMAKEFSGCKPSKELEGLLSYNWRRIYTWNIDDVLENVGRRALQNRIFYNGMIDKAVEFEGPSRLHIIRLHGDVNKPEHGFIFSEQEYASWIKSDNHHWYKRAALDYLSTCPVFIGSQLAEPILTAELERARREQNSVAGRSYLIIPNEPTSVQRAALAAKGIVHLQGTLESFYNWLQAKIPGGWSPKEVLVQTNRIPEKSLDNISFDDIKIANHIRIRDVKEIRAKFESLRSPEQDKFGRQFYQGFPPSWSIASSKIPVWLDAANGLYTALEAASEANKRLFVVSGQAGSGKTTALMMACLRYSEKHDAVLYELDPNVKSLGDAFRLLKRISAKKALVYVGDLFVYGDLFKDDLERVSGLEFMVVSTARSGEWNERLERYLGEVVTPFKFQRFSRQDFDPLIDRLIRYVPSPNFRRLNKKDQHAKLSQSKSQLLIALREATESETFDLTISNEFDGLPDQDTKRLFVIVGLATLARVGISRAVAKEAYQTIAEGRTFDDALKALEGIVSETEKARLVARHELYVRHVFDAIIKFADISACITAILKGYNKYNIPIVRMVSRMDSVLFRFLMNHDFIRAHARRHNAIKEGLEIYETFEIDFQLDGHFWLQYGLYLADIQELGQAAKMLGRSIQAYPGNIFAVHALADIELRLAKSRSTYDSLTQSLIEKAVSALSTQDAQTGLEIDQYPIVTLINGHLSALIKHRQNEESKRIARQYFDRVKEVEKVHPASAALGAAKERVMRFITLNEWNEKAKSPKDASNGKRPRRRRGFMKRPKA